MRDESQYLAIDIGNNWGKAALFLGASIAKRFRFPADDPSSFLDALSEIKTGIPAAISMVRNPGDEFLAQLEKNTRLLIVDGLTSTPLQMLYATPQTLGADRLAAAAGAVSCFPEHDLLVIDAGTCITIDVITHEGSYLGGSISPGISMRLKAMHHFTERLPLVTHTSCKQLIGTDTASSLGSGGVFGAVMEIEGRIGRLRQIYPEIFVLITGGNSFDLCTKINFNIFVMPDLVLQGLRAILVHHENI